MLIEKVLNHLGFLNGGLFFIGQLFELV